MTADREVANAISDGLNCVAEVVAVLKESETRDISSSVDPRWVNILQAMEGAFEAIMAKTVVTSLAVGEGDLDQIRRVRALVSDWLREGHPPQGLETSAGAVLKFFGLPHSSMREAGAS